MTKLEKQNAIANCMEVKKWDNGKEGYIIKDNLKAENEELYNLLINIIYEDNIGGVHDISYEITAKACGIIGDLTPEEIEEDNDDHFYEMETASVWNSDRLSYLNVNNEQEIADKMKELSLDSISTACAVWYDDQVRSVVLSLIDYIKKND